MVVYRKRNQGHLFKVVIFNFIKLSSEKTIYLSSENKIIITLNLFKIVLAFFNIITFK